MKKKAQEPTSLTATITQKCVWLYVQLVLLKRKLLDPNYYGRHHLAISFEFWSLSIHWQNHEDYIAEQTLLLEQLQTEVSGENFILEALRACRNCNFLILDPGDQGKFVQFWLGDGQIIADWPLTKGNKLQRYTYAMLGVLNNLGVTRDFKHDGQWPKKLHHCYTFLQHGDFDEYAVNFGKDSELASKFASLVITQVFGQKIENIHFRIG